MRGALRVAAIVFGAIALVVGMACGGLWLACRLACPGHAAPESPPVLSDATYERTIAAAGTVDAVEFLDDETVVFVAATEQAGQLRFVRVADGTDARPPITLEGELFDLALPRGGRFLVVAPVSHDVTVLDLAGSSAPTVLGPCGACTVAASPTGQWVAVARSAPSDGLPLLALYDPRTGALARDLTELLASLGPSTMFTEASPTSVAFSPDGSALGVARGERWAAVLDLATGTWRRSFDDREETSEHACIAFSPDGRVLAHTSIWRALRLHDLDDGAQLARLPWDADPNDWLRADVVFHPDGRRLFHIERSSTVVARDARTAEAIGALGAVPDPGPQRALDHDPALAHDATDLAISPDGRHLAYADEARGVRLFLLAP